MRPPYRHSALAIELSHAYGHTPDVLLHCPWDVIQRAARSEGDNLFPLSHPEVPWTRLVPRGVLITPPPPWRPW